jgi:tRNA threonylcarbamoyl adenosine modification protein YjeE
MRLDEFALVEWGKEIGRSVAAPVFIGLSGPLGAGKSVLARAIGAGAGVDAHMPSPTFTLLQRYPTGRGRSVVHLDLYRIGSPDELWELGWGQLPGDDEMVLVEWPERAGPLLPADRWMIELAAPPVRSDLREVSVTRVGVPPELAAFPLSLTR